VEVGHWKEKKKLAANVKKGDKLAVVSKFINKGLLRPVIAVILRFWLVAETIA